MLTTWTHANTIPDFVVFSQQILILFDKALLLYQRTCNTIMCLSLLSIWSHPRALLAAYEFPSFMHSKPSAAVFASVPRFNDGEDVRPFAGPLRAKRSRCHINLDVKLDLR